MRSLSALDARRIRGPVQLAASTSRWVVDGPTSPYDFLKMPKVLHPDDWNPQNLLIPLPPKSIGRGARPSPPTINSRKLTRRPAIKANLSESRNSTLSGFRPTLFKVFAI